MSAFPTWIGADDAIHKFYMRTDPLTVFDADSQLGHGCAAVKKELLYNGYGVSGFDPNKPLIGLQADLTIRQFQEALRLGTDGVAGPVTCKAIFRKRVLEVQSFYNIPNNFLGKIAQLESGWDPSARGTIDPHDRGLVQINKTAHPDVTDMQADDPQFALPWAANNLRSAYSRIRDWDATIAAWNVGEFYAKDWLAKGKPASGIILANLTDIARTCTQYVALVNGQVYA